MKSHLQAPKKLPFFAPLLLRQLCEGLLVAASVSCMPLCSTVLYLLTASPAPLQPRLTLLGALPGSTFWFSL